MSGRIRISMLGGFVAEVDGSAIPDSAWRLRKSRSVLKLLGLTPERALHPERIQGLLWPERDPASAGNNLRQAVYHARRALSGAGADGAAALELRGDLLALGSQIAIDVDAFEGAAARAASSGGTRDIELALAAYGGELLPEDAYEDWTTEPRRALAERYVRLLLALAEQIDPAGATEPLHRALHVDSLNQEAHRALMRAYAASGRRAQALEHYGELRQLLAHELGADPDPETRALYRELLAAGAPEPEVEGAAPLLAAVVPPPRAAPARHNLPWQPTSFIGRARELAELDSAIGSHRLVTLTGPGGCGKTRLALELGRRRVERHRDGVWVIELAGIADGALVGQAAAAALGLDLRPDEDAESGLAERLRERELLLVLDNCEHVLDPCVRLVETLLAQCPGVTIVATSREPLHLAGEVDWRVPSLAMLDTESLSDVAELANADAVELFVDRASSANPRFKLSVANAQAVAEICLRVDGLPLAIELADARTSALSPAEIASRLGDGLAVLRATRTGGLTRQQTLEGTLDWSYDMLGPRERALFQRLSVFAGGFELEAAEAITSDRLLAEHQVLDVLAGLVDKSLVGVDEAGASYRYRLLEPVRQYARLRLRESGELAALVERHAVWFAELVAAPGGRVTEVDPQWIARLERDHDNLRGSIAWMLEHDQLGALEAATGMAGLWLLRAHLREGSRWLDQALAGTQEPTPARAEAMHARQALERRRPHNYDLADALARGRIEIYRKLGDPYAEALSELDLADGFLLRGRYAEALDLADVVVGVASANGEQALCAAAHERRGLALAWRQDFVTAEQEFATALGLYDSSPEDAAASSAVVSLSGFLGADVPMHVYPTARLEETSMHFRRLRPRVAPASLMSQRAYLARATGDVGRSRTLLDEGLEPVRALGNPLDEARLNAQRGTLETHAEQLDAAEEWLGRSLDLRERLREHRGILLTLATLALVASVKGEQQRSDELLARAQRMADEAVDGPGMGGVLHASAEIKRRRGDLEGARAALREGLTVFYGATGLRHYAAWMHLQLAYLSMELGDGAEVAGRLTLAWDGFASSGAAFGPDRCVYLDERLRTANGLLTEGEWSPPGQQQRSSSGSNTTN